ncbi:carboxypeptidase-like regulatory domain-containing protein [Gemmatimonas sp.]|uniref:carboxypeptidase-like regulatory domain-containing protein n=1 Tax=Gemmatimonas sp. TaxID=1962908 RepID=UPI00286C943D|nr:carboxypeptidase-like regulatory domain-containing protein [Gemmatimonas sp.]
MKRRRLSAAVATWLVTSTTAAAQPVSVRVIPSVPDTVRGVVFDSLSGMPLEGAFVVGDGGEVSARTDSTGRFVLSAAAPVRRVVAYHELLDRIGVGALSAERPDGTEPWRPSLTTPGMNVVWSRFCTGRRPRNGVGGIVFGRAITADGATRLAGAQIELQWESTRLRADTIPRYESQVVRTDSVGEYVFCGVQEFGPAGVIASTATLRSAALLLPGDVVPIRRANVMLGAIADSVRTTVQGRVRDDNGQSISDAQVTVDGVAEPVRSAADGRFSMSGVPMGTRMMSVRKIGFLPYLSSIDVPEVGVPDYVAVVERGVSIEGVRVTARRSVSRDRREFEERKRLGMGTVMESTEIMKYPRTQSALRQFPALQIATANNGVDFTILGRVRSGGVRCQASLYVDGVTESSAYLAMLPPENIAAMELFPSGEFAPVRFRPVYASCAVLLVWTKNSLRG